MLTTLGDAIPTARRYAYVYGTMEHEVAGIALWLPPGTDITLMKMFKFGFAKLPLDTGIEQVGLAPIASRDTHISTAVPWGPGCPPPVPTNGSCVLPT